MSPTVWYLVLEIRCLISIKNKKSNQDIEIKFHEVVFVRVKKSSLRGYEREDHRHRDTVVDMKMYMACNKFMQPSPSFDQGECCSSTYRFSG